MTSRSSADNSTGMVETTLRDEELVERCLKGDQAAWKQLVNQYQRLVYSVARTLCSAPEDVSDVFQQVWLEVYQNLKNLREADAFPAWLMTITRRRGYALLRSRPGLQPLDEHIPEKSERLQQIEREHMVERALAEMPDRCRRLIELLYLDSKEPSYAQISAILNMPEASIGPTRARCLEKLRKLIR